MLTLNKQRSSRYQVDLAALHAVCAANYLGIHKLFPLLRSECSRCILLGSSGKLSLEVIERGPYTSLVALQMQDAIATPLPGICRVMVYHDVRMAEVVGFDGRRKLRGRYPYPNRHMHQKDEKWQMNRFLGEWIRHSLAHGRIEWQAEKMERVADRASGQWLEL